MSKRPLYENLDTAFVNLSALVKYLRRREFIGSLKISLNNYEASINLYEGNKISVVERDKISGRKAEGEEAFQRLLIRAREAGGVIHVYHAAEEIATEQKAEIKPSAEKPNANAARAGKDALSANEKAATASAPSPVARQASAAASKVAVASVAASVKSASAVVNAPSSSGKPSLANAPKFPFHLSGAAEDKARRMQISEQDWQTLLNLTGELLATIDKSLGEAGLDFKSAFAKARAEISPDYPFLHPSSQNFSYENGRVSMAKNVNHKLFVASVNESLRRILEKLGANPKFAETYRSVVQKTLALANARQSQYEKFSFAPQLNKILGV